MGKGADEVISCFSDCEGQVTHVTGVILAGGNSRRMKSNKALLPVGEELFIERIYRQLSVVFRNVFLVTNNPELYGFLPCHSVPDIFPGMGSLAGVHAGLRSSETPYVFATACDMPYLNTRLVRLLISAIDGQQLVIPESDEGLEPLHAIYGKSALPLVEAALRDGDPKLLRCCRRLQSTVIRRETVAGIDSEFLSFRNINTPEDYLRFREGMTGSRRRMSLSERNGGTGRNNERAGD
jgi:molybdopterin-guanine dinucleotide biosynthesis protein A